MFQVRMVLTPQSKRDPETEAQIITLDREIFGDVEGIGSSYWWLVWHNRAEAVGFAGMVLLSEDAVFLCRAGVLKRYRRRGLHQRLIRARLAKARQMVSTAITYTTIDNAPSANSLIKAGFRLYLPEYAWVGRNFLYWQKSLRAK